MTAQFIRTRYRAIISLGLATTAALAWFYMLHLGSAMADMKGYMTEMSAPQTMAWQTKDILTTFIMWVMMMVAMMIPSTLPMTLTYASLRRRAGESLFTAAALFVLGYLVIWFLFSAAATSLQFVLRYTMLLSPRTLSVTPLLGGMLLVAAGLYQLTPLKRTCLANCRSPFSLLVGEWRDGPGGTLLIGARHGVYCLGCCWLLMTLLFAAGVMNLLWVALIAVYVLVEKVAPGGNRVGQVIGLLVIIWGVWLLLGQLT